MTEAEWLVCEDAREMLTCLRKQHRSHGKKSSQRKLKLFGCASCRDKWSLLTDPKSRACVEVAEALADGLPTKKDPDKVRLAGEKVWRSIAFRTATSTSSENATNEAAKLLSPIFEWQYNSDAALEQGYLGDRVSKRKVARLRVLAGHLRDIFGNPFRPVTFPKSWRTEHTVGIASKMYDAREFAAMPILADALEEAGCDNADVLSHCREPGVHVRGCWVVDLVLGKA